MERSSKVNQSALACASSSAVYSFGRCPASDRALAANRPASGSSDATPCACHAPSAQHSRDSCFGWNCRKLIGNGSNI